MTRTGIVVDKQAFYTSVVSVVYVMIVSGIVNPHISIEVYYEKGLLWVALLTLGFMLARSLASLVHAPLYQKYTARVVGSIGLFLLITSFFLYSIVKPLYYPLVQIVTGFSAGIFWPLMQSLLAYGIAPNWRSRGFSLYFILGSIAGYAGYQLGSLIYVLLGPEFLYIVGYASGYVYLLLYIAIAPAKQPGKPRGEVLSLKDVLKTSRKLTDIIPLIILVGGINGLLKDYLLAYTVHVTGYSEPTIRNIWSIAGYVGLLLSYLAAHVMEKHSREREILLLGTLMCLSPILLAIITESLVVILAVALAIAGTRILRPILRGIASNRVEQPETSIAVVNSFSNISASLIPLLVALVTSVLYEYE
ncbi:MAG: MFS transporter [Thermoprotei archaeon]